MSHETNKERQEDELIVRLLDWLGDSGSEDLPIEDDLGREYVELLGLLPYGLEEVSASAGLEARILDEIGAPQARVVPYEISAPAAPSSRSWLAPIAATIMIGMAAVTGWLVVQVQSQQTTIAQLSAELENARTETREAGSSRGMLTELKERLALVTTPGAEFCALRSPDNGPLPAARGTVVMHPTTDDWFLRAEGLEPCAQGRRYMIWFVTADGEVPGAVFSVKAHGSPVEVIGSGKPAGVDGIRITLEDHEAPAEPLGETYLYGDESMQVL